MNILKATGQIRITKTPGGEAPPEVRECWVGLSLPSLPFVGFTYQENEYGVISGTRVDRIYGFSVPQKEAIEILEKSNWRGSAAAAYWNSLGYPKLDEYFGFALEEAEILKGVTHQHLRQVPDEARGQPTR